MSECAKISDEDLQLLVDGELPEILTHQVIQTVLANPHLFRKLMQHLNQRDSLRIWWHMHKMEH